MIGVAGTSPRTTVTAGSVTLADDDLHPAVTLSASPSTVGEGASATSVTVTATSASAATSARTVTVAVGSSGDGATEGTDYATGGGLHDHPRGERDHRHGHLHP